MTSEILEPVLVVGGLPSFRVPFSITTGTKLPASAVGLGAGAVSTAGVAEMVVDAALFRLGVFIALTPATVTPNRRVASGCSSIILLSSLSLMQTQFLASPTIDAGASQQVVGSVNALLSSHTDRIIAKRESRSSSCG